MRWAGEYQGNVVNTVSGDITGGTVIQGRDVQVTLLPNHEVNWPVRVGAVPERAAHYQHRGVTDQLGEALNGFGNIVPRQVLSGTGGAGKTQLAAHHARTLLESTGPERRLDVLVWVDASSRERVTSAYAEAARRLYAAVPEDPEDAAALFLSWLQRSGGETERRWLIVWDDLSAPAQVKDLWPPHDRPHSRVLVTTRRRDSSLAVQGRHLIDVDVHTPDEAHVFLAQALSAAGIDHTLQELDSLSRDLGQLPLALGQAVTYMAELGLGCEDYRRVFHDRMNALEEVFPAWEQPTPLAATWDLSLTQADTFRPPSVARPLMGLIALLDGNGIPESVLTSRPVLECLAAHRTREDNHRTRQDNSSPSPDASSPSSERAPGLLARFRRTLSLAVGSASTSPAEALSPHEARAALSSLTRLNLTTRAASPASAQANLPETALVKAHELVQRATREHTSTSPTRESVRAAADALVEVWPEIERDSALAQLLRTQTRTLYGRTVRGRSTRGWLWQPEVHEVLPRAGNSLGGCGRVTEAIACWEQMVEHAGHYAGPDHPDTAETLLTLGRWHYEAGDVKAAVRASGQAFMDKAAAERRDRTDDE